jgi:hypothetical protein
MLVVYGYCRKFTKALKCVAGPSQTFSVETRRCIFCAWRHGPRVATRLLLLLSLSFFHERPVVRIKNLLWFACMYRTSVFLYRERRKDFEKKHRLFSARTLSSYALVPPPLFVLGYLLQYVLASNAVQL